MSHETEPQISPEQRQLFVIGEKFLALISQAHVSYKIAGRDTGSYLFRHKEVGNLFVAMRVPSDCGASLTSFIFWQLLRDEENQGVGHDYHVLSFARSGHVLKGVVNVSDEVNRVKSDLDLPSVDYSAGEVDVASIARDAEALVSSDRFDQKEQIFGAGLDGFEELLGSIEVETEVQLALGLDEC